MFGTLLLDYRLEGVGIHDIIRWTKIYQRIWRRRSLVHLLLQRTLLSDQEKKKKVKVMRYQLLMRTRQKYWNFGFGPNGFSHSPGC